MNQEQTNGYATRITQANRSELVVIIYDIIIDLMDEAIVEEKEGNLVQFRKNLKRARKFVNELMGSLDYKYEISFELMPLYIFVDKEMVGAISGNDGKRLVGARLVLEKLSIAFSDLAKQDKSQSVMRNTETIYAGLTYGKNSLNESVDLGAQRRGYQA